MLVNEFRARAVPTVGCAYKSVSVPDTSVWTGLPTLKGLRPSHGEGIAALPARRPGFPLLRPVSPKGRGAAQRRAGGLKRGDAGLGAGRHFAATGTAMPGIFTFTAPRWLRLVM
jgi:hypothetical protein